MKTRTLATACLLTLLPLGTACSLTQSNNPKSTKSGAIQVTATDSACKLSQTNAESGNLAFKVTNKGTKVTEFYLYAKNGKSIVAEVENIGPGLSRDLVAQLTPGSYVSACKPGMVGDGIRAKFTVTDSGKGSSLGGVDPAAVHKATEHYADYVRDQADALVADTQSFITAYKSGDDAEARRLFAPARTPWENIEPVAESFGDLDPLTDLREADLEPGQQWTGWHRIEKDLWPPKTGPKSRYVALTPAERVTYADDLMKNITTLHKRVQKLDYTVAQIGNGAKELLDEVATGKITGEEDIWSHTDLWDFQANLDGARAGYQALKPLLAIKDPKLSAQIGPRFTAVQKLLNGYRNGPDFVSYDKVTEDQRRELSDAVQALAEPLAKVTGAITL